MKTRFFTKHIQASLAFVVAVRNTLLHLIAEEHLSEIKLATEELFVCCI